MPQRLETATVDSLLEHSEWVRRLATRLVRDDSDDAVQDSWLSALRSPPDASRPPRPWLARVLHNAARRRFRDDSAQRAVEAKAAALMEDAPTPEQLVQRAQTHRLLVDLVLGLEEPFRQVVLLRFFEGRSSAEIARATGVPAGTVRWRLKEGVDRLRRMLDDRHGGDREAWGLVVAPLAVAPGARLGPMGVIAMAMKTKVAVVAGVALLAGLLALVGPRCGEPAGGPPEASESAGTGPALAKPAVRGTPREAIASAREAVASPSPSRDPAGPGGSAATAPIPVASGSAVAPESRSASVGDSAARTGAVASDGGIRYPIDKEGIRAAVKAAMPEVRDCYDAWLKLQPGLGGRVKASFTIDTDDGVVGKVEGVSLGDAGLGHFAMEGCILSAFQDLRFEAPMDGPINVTYPLAFSSGSDAGQ